MSDHLPPSGDATAPEHLDVVVVGAGLSGIGAACRLRAEHPGRSFALLEARDRLGGTWDLFRYPGVRSDSDMFTLGYSFKPWRDPQSIADGPSVLAYIHETAREFGVDRHVRLRTRVVSADWSSADARWTLGVEERAEDGSVRGRTLTCSFLYACAGYYDHDRGHAPELPGIGSFRGRVVHPQFWPEDLDWTDRRVVVVGSGATAVTLVPAMAAGAARVTMLQRSPTWVAAVPGRDRRADALRRVLPPALAHRAIRTKNILFSTAFFQFCRRRPAAARALLTRRAARALGSAELVAEHFTPSYDPWDQRLCAVPDADLFTALRRGRAEVVTDTIDTFVPGGIRLGSGRVLEADVVVTATGLRLLPLGGVEVSVDGTRVELSEQFVWNGAMLTGVPNFAMCFGYSNASWTLRADLTHRLVCKVLRHMDRHDAVAVVPKAAPRMAGHPLLELSSGYVRRSIAAFPRQGDRRPWRVRQNYLLDAATVLHTPLSRSLDLVPRAAPRRGTAT
jgi:cation diffusion facilitator CzcD-associated flavoprotein CzcO